MVRVKNRQSNRLQKKHLKLKIKDKKYFKNLLNKEKQYTIAIFIPHKGCKNECVFCNQRKISGNINAVTPDEVDKIIQRHLEYLQDTDYKIQIAFFGGSFTGLSIKEQTEYLEVAYKYVKNNQVDSIRLSTRPDYISKEILSNLKKYKVKNIELGVQSMSDIVLEASKRGHTSKQVVDACKLIKRYNIKLGIQIMIGLPKSSLKEEIYTINRVLALRPRDLRIYPVYVIHPSELYNMCLNNTYNPLSLKEAVERTSAVVKRCIGKKVRIIRLGLQSTDEITQSNEKIKGPVSDNLAEYVYSKIILDDIDKFLMKKKNINGKTLIVEVNNRYASMVIGPKKINKEYILNKYKVKLKIKGE